MANPLTLPDTFNPTGPGLVADPGVLTVDLRSLTASPTIIRPFEASTISWEVGSFGGPAPQIRINNQAVAATGTMNVRPTSDSVYRLSAKINGTFVQLGQVNVQVDRSDCEFGGIAEAVGILGGTFEAMIEQDPELYFQNIYDRGQVVGKHSPIVEIDDTGINLSLRMKAVVDYFPNPKINVDLRFRWGVIDDVIEPVFIKQDISIKFPFYAWGIPGAIPGLAIASGFARDRTRDGMRNGLIAFAGLFLSPPTGRRIVSIRTSSAARGTFETMHCADPVSNRPFSGGNAVSPQGVSELKRT